MSDKTYVYGGFEYFNEEEAKQAALETKKIEYMESKLDYSNPEQIHKIYEKAVKEEVFKSQAGVCYLKRIQNFLLEQSGFSTEQVSPIPSTNKVKSVRVIKDKPVEKTKKDSKINGAFFVSVVTNIALVIAVIIMFVIALTTDNPNMLNYERTLQDKYSKWEHSIMEREQAVREKEREYNMEIPVDSVD